MYFTFVTYKTTTQPEKKNDADFFLKYIQLLKKACFTSLIPMLTYKQLRYMQSQREMNNEWFVNRRRQRTKTLVLMIKP